MEGTDIGHFFRHSSGGERKVPKMAFEMTPSHKGGDFMGQGGWKKRELKVMFWKPQKLTKVKERVVKERGGTENPICTRID